MNAYYSLSLSPSCNADESKHLNRTTFESVTHQTTFQQYYGAYPLNHNRSLILEGRISVCYCSFYEPLRRATATRYKVFDKIKHRFMSSVFRTVAQKAMKSQLRDSSQK